MNSIGLILCKKKQPLDIWVTDEINLSFPIIVNELWFSIQFKKKLSTLTWTAFLKTSFIFTGSLESPLAASPSQAYHPSSTYFHQECQWFFDTPPARQLILKISTAQKMSKSKSINRGSEQGLDSISRNHSFHSFQ